MDTPQNIQILNDAQGQPAFVVIPYADYMAQQGRADADADPHDNDLIPNEIARRIFTDGMSPARAWREHLGLTQKEVATRMGVSQPTYNDMESGERKLRKASREKIAAAFNIPASYLDL